MKIARMLITCLLVLAACQSIDAQSPQEGSRSSADPNQDAKRKQQKRRDQLKIAVQEICPTTGAKLGEHVMLYGENASDASVCDAGGFAIWFGMWFAIWSARDRGGGATVPFLWDVRKGPSSY